MSEALVLLQAAKTITDQGSVEILIDLAIERMDEDPIVATTTEWHDKGASRDSVIDKVADRDEQRRAYLRKKREYNMAYRARCKGYGVKKLSDIPGYEHGKAGMPSRSVAKSVTLFQGDAERANPDDNPDLGPANGRVLADNRYSGATKLKKGHYSLEDYSDPYTRGVIARLVEANKTLNFYELSTLTGVSVESCRNYCNLRQLNPVSSTVEKFNEGLSSIGA